MAKHIYRITLDFPTEEKFGLVSQMRRAAVSIPSNIAEGSSRSGRKDFQRFVEIAMGSSFELETQLILAGELELVEINQSSEVASLLSSLQRRLNALRSKLREK